MDKDRAEPLIFDAFLRALHQILLIDKTGVDLDDKGPFDATTLISLIKDHPSWCDAPGKPDPDCRAGAGARARRRASRCSSSATAPT